MVNLNLKQQKILSIFLKKDSFSSSKVNAEMILLGEKTSLVTTKRALSEMAKNEVLVVVGSGRSTNYSISSLGRIFTEVHAHLYCSVEPDRRYSLKSYNFDLLSALSSDIFSAAELKTLHSATAVYKQRTSDLPEDIQKKELERLIIELSWKSSKIEGNTYTLLDTEKLILENKEAPGHDKKEAQMILNHKDAFNFVRASPVQYLKFWILKFEIV